LVPIQDSCYNLSRWSTSFSCVRNHCGTTRFCYCIQASPQAARPRTSLFLVTLSKVVGVRLHETGQTTEVLRGGTTTVGALEADRDPGVSVPHCLHVAACVHVAAYHRSAHPPPRGNYMGVGSVQTRGIIQRASPGLRVFSLASGLSVRICSRVMPYLSASRRSVSPFLTK